MWLDLDKNNGKIPIDDGAIWLKIKRISWESSHSSKKDNNDNTDNRKNTDNHQQAISKGVSSHHTPAGHKQSDHKPNKKSSFEFEDLNHGNAINHQNHKSLTPQNLPKKTADNMVDLDIDLSGMNTPSSKKEFSKNSVNLMEDFLL